MQGAGQVREIKGEIRGPSCVPGRWAAAAVPAPDSLSAAGQGGAVLPLHTWEYLNEGATPPRSSPIPEGMLNLQASTLDLISDSLNEVVARLRGARVRA